MSLQANHNKRGFECFYPSSPSISDSCLPSPFPKQNFLILAGRLIGVKTTENPHWDDQKVPLGA